MGTRLTAFCLVNLEFLISDCRFNFLNWNLFFVAKKNDYSICKQTSKRTFVILFIKRNSCKQRWGYAYENAIFFSISCGRYLYPLNRTNDLQLISLDFERFCNFFNVVTNRWTDGPMDRQTNWWSNGCTMFLLYTNAMDASKMLIYHQILLFLQKHYGPTHRRTDGPMDQRTNGRTNPLIEMRWRI